MSSPQNPTPEQYAALETAGQSQLMDSPAWMKADSGRITTKFTLPRQGISPVQVSW
jgi:xylan 1,4-beta-xylosidase